MATGIGNLPYVMPPVSPFDTITAQETNERIANIEAVADGSGIGDGAISAVAIEDNAVTTAKIADNTIAKGNVNWTSTGGIWWEELGRTTLSVANSTVSVTGVSTRKNLQVIFRMVSPSTTTAVRLRFNNDSGNNYAIRTATDGAADSTSVSQNNAQLVSSTAAALGIFNIDVDNAVGTEKLCICQASRVGTGATNAPARDESVFKWANTSDQVTRVDIITSAGTWGVGTELIILGHD